MFLGTSGRAADATEFDLRRRAREHLGYRPFDDEARSRLEGVFVIRSHEELLVGDLVSSATRLLNEWRVVLPGPATLSRLCGQVGAEARSQVYESITSSLDPAARLALDELLIVNSETRISSFGRLKEDPAEASPKRVLAQLERYHTLEAVGLGLDIASISPFIVHDFAELARHHDASELREVSEPKRSALLACFVVEGSRMALDQVVALHDQYILGLERRAKRSYERTYRQSRRQARKGMDTMVSAFDFVLDDGRPEEALRENLFREFGKEELKEALETCRHFREVERAGLMEKIKNYYPSIRQYLPILLQLPFEAELGSETILAAIDLVQKLDAAGRRTLPADAPIEFLAAKFRRAVLREDGTLDRAVWEIGLAKAVKDALRSSDLFLPQSRNYVSFGKLLHSKETWEVKREAAYRTMALPGPDDAIERLRGEFEVVVARTAEGISENSFASIEGGKLCLGRDPAMRRPPGLPALQREIQAAYPRTRLEQVLLDVNDWCGFTQDFHPMDGSQRSGDLDEVILATLVANGTNLGIAAMGRSAEGISTDQLRHVSRWYLREGTLAAANATLIRHLDSVGISRVWGDGALSSSDGQRFGIQPSSYLGGFYPRYFGYTERAISLYTHVSDQHSVFSTRVISCGVREALHVLDGLLENNSILEPREHCTDTHGFTEHIFALCYLLGFSFHPCFKDLKDQCLYRPDRNFDLGVLDPLVGTTVNLGLIREQWDQMVRVAASLLDRTTPAHVVVERLSRTTRSDRLSKAFTALGRLVKTIYILRYLDDPGLRRKIRVQLNRGEARHSLARWLFFANYGAFDTKAYAEIMNKASSLSLLSNAIAVWNAVHMDRNVRRLRAAGREVRDEDLALISPLARKHIIPHGTYRFARSNVGG
jgi:TnpA family transposase